MLLQYEKCLRRTQDRSKCLVEKGSLETCLGFASEKFLKAFLKDDFK